VTVKNSLDVVKVMVDILQSMNQADRNKECVWTVLLDARNNIRAIDLVYMGSVCGMPVKASEIYRVAVTSGAVSMILVHNHPAGSTEPSNEDIAMTRKIFRAGKLLGVRLIDSIIITESGGFYSIMDNLPK
jgi:DNA repair protein RadC